MYVVFYLIKHTSFSNVVMLNTLLPIFVKKGF